MHLNARESIHQITPTKGLGTPSSIHTWRKAMKRENSHGSHNFSKSRAKSHNSFFQKRECPPSENLGKK